MISPNSRPIGVILVAILYLAIAVVSLVVAARYVLIPTGSDDLILLFTRLKLPVTFLNLLAVPPLLSAGLATLMFRGLWEGKAWSRVATVVFSFIGMLTALAMIAFFQVFNFGDASTFWMTLGAFALFTLIFVYFLKMPWPDSEPAPVVQPAVRPATPNASPPSPPSMQPFAPASSQGLYESISGASTVVAGMTAATSAETVRLNPEVERTPRPWACMTTTSGQDRGQRFDLFNADILVGRHPTLADVLLSDPTISAQHARLRNEDGQFMLYDLDSTNGSFVNGQRIRMRRLQDQDRIKLGAVELIFTTSCQE